MPNWCFNKVTVTGDEKKMDVFKNKAFVNDEPGNELAGYLN